MKFGKEIASQMVHEWQEAYMNYTNLKQILKEILHFKQRKKDHPLVVNSQSTLMRKGSLYTAFSGLTRRYNTFRGSPRRQTNEDEVILVTAGQQQEDGLGGYCQTMFLMSTDEGGEYEVEFFKRLDDELNKVLKFYRKKVEQVMKEAEQLNRQMDAIIAFRIRVENPIAGSEGSECLKTSSVASPVNERARLDAISGVKISERNSSVDENLGTITEDARINKKSDEGKAIHVGYRTAPLEVLDHVKINVTCETPMSTLKSILMTLNLKSDNSFSKNELKKVEEQMKQAFIIFYQKLGLLRSYCFLNLLAFSKIMKKYEKITSRSASKAYMKMVDNSYLGSSDEITKLMERVEDTFIKHFSNGNRRKGMITLRPKAKRERHRITYFLGFFSGCNLALVLAIIVLTHARDLLKSEGRGKYMENIFPLYSLFGFIVLHMLMYAADIYFWRHYRINHSFIFGFKPGTELSYREVALLGSGLAMLTLAGVLSNLDMEMDPRTQSFKALTELVPLGLVLVVLLVAFCPFNIIYRSSRFFLIKCTMHCILAPLYKVEQKFRHQLCETNSKTLMSNRSVQAFRSLEFYVCYYGWGDFRTRSNRCRDSKIYVSFYFIIAAIPYWIRFLQCLRRLFEEKDSMQGLNGLKYLSTIVAVVMRTAYDIRSGLTWKIMAAASSSITTIGSIYWDIVIDWGLLLRKSRNPWLREKLPVPNKRVYFAAIVLNVLLRFAWMQSVLGFRETQFLHRTAMSAIFACLEIIRRGIWNFFRLENEHLNNVGKYTAFKSVPLPFSYDDESKDA
ncbi:EXS, C-terminal [Dillenia turbinata]|uniref:EXS, C-terminal n=1 Tax=Dillenia turbinata TaxID=194707 RepID=A0AAN8YUA9_9MAGN